MSERKNVQTEHKWVASSGRSEYSAGYYYETAGAFTAKLRNARLYDSPSDVPDDCTPVRVQVETWEEEGEPEKVTSWDWKSDTIKWAVAYTESGELVKNLEPFKHRSAAEQKAGDYVNWCVLPVRIPTETKRKVTLDPEPTETGCRCREKVDEMLDDQSRAMTVNYRRGWIDALEAVRRNLADCDCKARETVQ